MKAVKAPIAFAIDEHVEEELERHVVVGQDQRSNRPLHVVQVVQDDRGEHHDSRVPVRVVRGPGIDSSCLFQRAFRRRSGLGPLVATVVAFGLLIRRPNCLYSARAGRRRGDATAEAGQVTTGHPTAHSTVRRTAPFVVPTSCEPPTTSGVFGRGRIDRASKNEHPRNGGSGRVEGRYRR